MATTGRWRNTRANDARSIKGFLELVESRA